MNLYCRYFDNEILAYSVDELIDFLSSIGEINITQDLVSDLREYAESKIMFPKRYKVRTRVYFIIIKTEAQTMQDFKEKKAIHTAAKDAKLSDQQRLNEELFGWYEGQLDFKRVIVNHLGKCEYRDTTIKVQCKANSPKDCYDRIVENLEERVDSRSQFPSAKGKAFAYKFLGFCKEEVPESEENKIEEPQEEVANE